jgi:hypothetical protein
MPSIVFMDEPTSGLDGAATVNLAKCLGLLKETGLTIICVIHQPRWLVFKEFTHLLLLGEGGQQIFTGRSEFMVPYLNDLGFPTVDSENPADWMIDVCSNLEKRYLPSGEVDNNFECPRDLYKEWQEKYAADSVMPGSRFYQGDAKHPDLEPLVPRVTPGCCGASFITIGRIFRKTSLQSELMSITVFVFLAMFDSLGAVIGLTQDCSGMDWNTLNQTCAPSFIFAVFVNIQHRFDYGDDKLIISREINSGVLASGIWIGRTTKSLCFATIKFLIYAGVRYILDAPMIKFITYAFAWILLGNWWVAFSQWISLACKSQITGVMIMLMVPFFELLISGNFCGSVMETEVASGFCPRGGMNGWGFWPGYPFFVMNWVGRLNEYPDHVTSFRPVNMTAYWYDVPNDEVKRNANTLCGTAYESVTYVMTGDGVGGGAFGLIITNLIVRCIVLWLLVCMSQGRSGFLADKIARCTGFCMGTCGICKLKGFSVPDDELTRTNVQKRDSISASFAPVGSAVRLSTGKKTSGAKVIPLESPRPETPQGGLDQVQAIP